MIDHEFDAYDCDPRPPLRWRRIALAVLTVAAGVALLAWLQHREAQAQESFTAWSLEFVACAGPDCRPVQIPWAGSLMQCMLFGQHALAAWQRDHPGMTVPHGYRCTSEREA